MLYFDHYFYLYLISWDNTAYTVSRYFSKYLMFNLLFLKMKTGTMFSHIIINGSIIMQLIDVSIHCKIAKLRHTTYCVTDAVTHSPKCVSYCTATTATASQRMYAMHKHDHYYQSVCCWKQASSNVFQNWWLMIYAEKLAGVTFKKPKIDRKKTYLSTSLL